MTYKIQTLGEPWWLAIPWGDTLHIEMDGAKNDLLDVYYHDITIAFAIAGYVGYRMRLTV